jgi:hypothetical protein
MNIEITKDGRIIKDGKELSTFDSRGYRTVGINKKMYSVHRLVAKQFIPNPDNKPFVNHKNGIKSDNRVENLEWVTRSENLIHSYRKLGVKPRTQKRIVSIEMANQIKMKYSTGKYTLQQLADEYGFKSRTSVHDIIKNKTYNFV